MEQQKGIHGIERSGSIRQGTDVALQNSYPRVIHARAQRRNEVFRKIKRFDAIERVMISSQWQSEAARPASSIQNATREGMPANSRNGKASRWLQRPMLAS